MVDVPVEASLRMAPVVLPGVAFGVQRKAALVEEESELEGC